VTVSAAAAEYTPGVSVVAPTVVESSVVVRNLLVARYSDSKSALMESEPVRPVVLMLPVCVIVEPERVPTDPTSPVTVVVPALLKAAPEKAAYVLAWPKVNAESCSALI
jgi:glyoxylate carboligase